MSAQFTGGLRNGSKNQTQLYKNRNEISNKEYIMCWYFLYVYTECKLPCFGKPEPTENDTIGKYKGGKPRTLQQAIRIGETQREASPKQYSRPYG